MNVDAKGKIATFTDWDGDLQQIDADAVSALPVYSLGQFAPADARGAMLRSDFFASLGALTVTTDASHVTFTGTAFGAIRALSLDHVQILAAGIANPGSTTPATITALAAIKGTEREAAAAGCRNPRYGRSSQTPRYQREMANNPGDNQRPGALDWPGTP